MSDTTAAANAAKPSSSVKLVLLGEAAVGKVLITTLITSHPTLPPLDAFSRIKKMQVTDHQITVIPSPALRKRRFPTKQRTHNRRRVPDKEDHLADQDDKIRNLGHGGPGAVRVLGAHVLPQRAGRARGVRPHQAVESRQS